MGYLIINSQQDYQDYPPSLTYKGGSFEPLELPLLRRCHICWIFTVQVPTVETTSTSVVGIISERLGKRRIVDNGSFATAVAIFLALGTAFRFPETDPAHVESWAVRTDWLDHPLVGTPTASVIDIITERGRPWGACTPAGTQASHSLTLLAAFGLSKAKTIFLVCGNVALLFDSPSILVSVSSVVCVVSEWLWPSGAGAPPTAGVHWSLALTNPSQFPRSKF